MAQPLDPAEHIESAVESVASDDFGSGAWRDGLERLCESANTQADLNDIGGITIRGRIDQWLGQRLRTCAWIAEHPEVLDETIEPSVVVAGLPRTGTTALTHLLAQDPATRSLREWESATLVPPAEASTYFDDPRIAAVQGGMDMAREFMPGLAALYDADASSPAEAIDLHGLSFRCMQLDGMAWIPGYVDWLVECDMSDAYRFHRLVSQMLQSRCPPRRWQFKNPADIFWLETVDAVYPDTTFVWTHRDPVAVLPSVCSLIALIGRLSSDSYDPRLLGPRQVELWAQGVERGIAARERLGEHRFVDVWMDDLVRDPIGEIGQIYDRTGWELTLDAETAMIAWLADHRQGHLGVHEPDPAEFGLELDAIRERFASYTERFSRTD